MSMFFDYVGYTTNRQIVKGRVSADNLQAATEMLANLDYFILSLKPVTAFVPGLKMVVFESKIKTSELVTFSRQLALLLESGIGIIRALELLGSQTSDKALRGVLTKIIADLRGGKSLGESISKYSHLFTPIFGKMISVGERTGSLDTVLRNLADYSEKESQSASKLKTAMTYPIIVLVMGIIVGFILITIVLPPIVNLFQSLGGQLPWPTLLLIGSVAFFKQFGLVIVIIAVAACLAMLVYTRSRQGRYFWDGLKLRAPVLGRLMHVSELARLCRNMSLLFKAGLPLTDVITLSAQAVGNSVISGALIDVGQDAIRGKGLSEPMRSRPAFLPLMVELLKVGEETGNLEQTLGMIAQNYETEAETRTQRMLALIEPVMTIVMGGFVAFLALSIFLPLYSSLSLIK
jgi:type IV pilus assembly protein PilC